MLKISKTVCFSIGDCVGDCVGDWSGTGRGLVGDCSHPSTAHPKPLKHAAAATTRAPTRTPAMGKANCVDFWPGAGGERSAAPYA